MSPEETLDVEAAIDRLNEALELQSRSAIAYTLFAGSILGLEYHGLGDQLWEFATRELDDTRRLVEKITALGGDPNTRVAEPRWTADAREAVVWLIESEEEAIEALREAIEPTGREGRSEAVEHLLEHIILRKQDQVDFLMRLQGRPGD